MIGSRIPARLLRRMTALANVHAAFTSHQAGAHQLAAWAKTHPEYADIVSKIRVLREKNA